jgi:hypothetical protein
MAPLTQREQHITELEDQIDRLPRTEEAIVVSTDAPRERGCLPRVVLGAKVVEDPSAPPAAVLGVRIADKFRAPPDRRKSWRAFCRGRSSAPTILLGSSP